MTALTPVDAIAGLLDSANYQRLPMLKIGTLDFDIPAAYVGKDKSTDLILIFDTAFQPMPRIHRDVIAIARSLDVAQSRRSLTTIITGARPDPRTIEPIARVSRVLIATDTTNQQQLRDAVAVLLPLNLPVVSETAPDVREVLQSLKKSSSLAEELVASASNGEQAVQDTLITAIEESFSAAMIEEESHD